MRTGDQLSDPDGAFQGQHHSESRNGRQGHKAQFCGDLTLSYNFDCAYEGCFSLVGLDSGLNAGGGLVADEEFSDSFTELKSREWLVEYGGPVCREYVF